MLLILVYDFTFFYLHRFILLAQWISINTKWGAEGGDHLRNSITNCDQLPIFLLIFFLTSSGDSQQTLTTMGLGTTTLDSDTTNYIGIDHGRFNFFSLKCIFLIHIFLPVPLFLLQKLSKPNISMSFYQPKYKTSLWISEKIQSTTLRSIGVSYFVI